MDPDVKLLVTQLTHLVENQQKSSDDTTKQERKNGNNRKQNGNQGNKNGTKARGANKPWYQSQGRNQCTKCLEKYDGKHECKAIGKTCTECGKLNHYARACRQRANRILGNGNGQKRQADTNNTPAKKTNGQPRAEN